MYVNKTSVRISPTFRKINNENELLNDLDKSTYRFIQKKNMDNLALPSLIKKILNALKNYEILDF